MNSRLNLRSEAHHRIHATEGTGEEGNDTGYWERKGEKIREKINMTPISKQSMIQINVSSSNLGLRVKKHSRRIRYRSYEQYIQGRLLIIER